MNKKNIHCARCGRIVELDDVERDGLITNCPDCEDETLVSPSDVRTVLNSIDSEATNHHADYASGMRMARQIVEEELLRKVRDE